MCDNRIFKIVADNYFADEHIFYSVPAQDISFAINSPPVNKN